MFKVVKRRTDHKMYKISNDNCFEQRFIVLEYKRYIALYIRSVIKDDEGYRSPRAFFYEILINLIKLL